MHVANGTTTVVDPESASCRKLAEAGAVRIRWPEDLTRKVPEPETFSWHILQKQRHVAGGQAHGLAV